MAINIPVEIDRERFERVLLKKGWKKKKFNGKEAFVKEQRSWLWVALYEKGFLTFISFPSDESSYLHSKGVKLLKEEVREIGKGVGFSLPLRFEEVVEFWSS